MGWGGVGWGEEMGSLERWNGVGGESWVENLDLVGSECRVCSGGVSVTL